MNIIGLDVGSTGCKAIIFNSEGKILGSGFQEYGIEYDNSGKAEQNAEKIWMETCGVIKKALNSSPVRQIKAIGISVQGDAVIPVDKNFNPTHNAILGMDYRSSEFLPVCEEIFGSKKLFKLTGMRPHPINSLTKILWFKNKKPSEFKKTYKITTYADFIVGKLCGSNKTFIDFTMASRTMAFDLKKRKWSDYILNKLEINKEMLSEPVPSGISIGSINKKIAEELELPANMIVATGGHDQTCAALGAGIIYEGLGLISTGTAEVLSTGFFSPLLNDTMYNSYYPCYIHAKDDMYFTFSLNHVGGLLLKWFRDNFCEKEIDITSGGNTNIYKYLDGKISETPSNILFLPHLNGSGTPVCDLSSKGAIVGLKISSSKYDIYKSMLESLVYELKINIETLKKAGISLKKLFCAGGGAKSPVWLQIKADILNREIDTLKISEAACLGAAILAGKAAGIYKNIIEGVNATVKSDKTFTPDRQLSEIYSKKYTVYKQLYPALKSINEQLD